MDHINDRADMSIFDGTEFEGLTYMQVRRMLNERQLRALKTLNKRARKTEGLKKAERRLITTYK